MVRISLLMEELYFVPLKRIVYNTNWAFSSNTNNKKFCLITCSRIDKQTKLTIGLPRLLLL